MIRRIPFDNIARFGRRVAQTQQSGAVDTELEAMLLFDSILALVMLPLATSTIWRGARGLPVLERDTLRRQFPALLTGGMQPLRPAKPPKRLASLRSKS
ncbi:MAG: hypothetical protein ACREU6_10605 [Steroidobacteraceae bacterium]